MHLTAEQSLHPALPAECCSHHRTGNGQVLELVGVKSEINIPIQQAELTPVKHVGEADGTLPGELRAARADVEVEGHHPVAVASKLSLHTHDAINHIDTDLLVASARRFGQASEGAREVPFQPLLEGDVTHPHHGIERASALLAKDPILSGGIHDPSLHVDTDIGGGVGGYADITDREIVHVGVSPTEVDVQHIGEESPAT